MDAFEILKSIKVILGTIPSKEGTLKDGTLINYDKLEVGGAIYIGTKPAPDGDYILSDDSTITCVGGLITEIKPVDVKPEDKPVEMEATEPIEEVKAELSTEPVIEPEVELATDPIAETPAEPIMSVEERLTNLETLVNGLVSSIESIVEMNKQTQEKLSAQPIERVKPINKTITKQINQPISKHEENLNAIIDLIG